jgi:hypothetical protein
MTSRIGFWPVITLTFVTCRKTRISYIEYSCAFSFFYFQYPCHPLGRRGYGREKPSKR